MKKKISERKSQIRSTKRGKKKCENNHPQYTEKDQLFKKSCM